MILMIDDYCLQSYYEESVSVSVSVEIWNTHPPTPFEGGICVCDTIK